MSKVDVGGFAWRRRIRILSLLAVYIVAIVAANLLVARYGPGVTVINAFALIGLDLVLRDYLHDSISRQGMLALILMSGSLSYLANPATAHIAAASTIAFVAASLADWSIYEAAKCKPWLVRSNASNMIGAAVDSLVFPSLAFGVVLWPVVVGQFAAKVLGGGVWSVMLARGRANVTADNDGA